MIDKINTLEIGSKVKTLHMKASKLVGEASTHMKDVRKHIMWYLNTYPAECVGMTVTSYEDYKVLITAVRLQKGYPSLTGITIASLEHDKEFRPHAGVDYRVDNLDTFYQIDLLNNLQKSNIGK